MSMVGQWGTIPLTAQQAVKDRYHEVRMVPSPLSSLVSFTTSSDKPLLPPEGTQVLVTDTLACPAAFLLVHFARSALLESPQSSPTPVIWLSCDGQGLPHWTSICRKVGLNLQQHIAQGSLTYIDASDLLYQEEGEEGVEPLKALYALVREQLEDKASNPPDENGMAVKTGNGIQSSPRAIVIVDDISSLAWSLRSGPSLNEVDPSAKATGRWAVALRALCEKHASSLITLQHSQVDSLSTQTFNRLLRSSSLWIEVKELPSGKARDCTGEIAVHALGGAEGNIITPAKGSGKAVLFLTKNDGKTSFWARGTQGSS